MNIDNILQAIYDWPISGAIRVDYFWFPFFESIHVIATTLRSSRHQSEDWRK